jgi:hypothetical protein
MRLLKIVAAFSLLLSIGSQACADTYLVAPGEVDTVIGPFVADNPIPVSISLSVTGGNYVGLIPPDGLVGPYYGYFISLNVQSLVGPTAFAQTCSYNQVGSGCGRLLGPVDKRDSQ